MYWDAINQIHYGYDDKEQKYAPIETSSEKQKTPDPSSNEQGNTTFDKMVGDY